MKLEYSINDLTENDVQAVSHLNSELGYQTEADTISNHLDLIIESNSDLAFSATIDGNIVAYIHGRYQTRLTSTLFFEICALVVSKNYRRSGIATALISHLENRIDSVPMRVRCSVNRNEAHQFYESLGFTESKEQKVFVKLSG